MAHISELLPAAMADQRPSTATLAPPMPGVPTTIPEWEKCRFLVPFQTLNDTQLSAMLTAAATLLHEMATGGQPRWLTLLGTSGAGKTMLGRAVHEAVKFYRLTRSFVSDPAGEGLGSYHRAEYRIHLENALDRALAEREWSWFDDLCRARFALVDEIGGDLVPRKVSAPKLAALAERRLGKWTVFTGNVSMQTIKEQWDARIASRILRGGSVVIDVDVTDFNLR